MILRNYPLTNARPRGSEETRNYVAALDLKNEAEQVAKAMMFKDGDGIDLDPTSNSVVMDDRNIGTGDNIGWADVTGVVNFEGTAREPDSVFLHADIDPDRGQDRTLTIRQDGDLVRYTRQFAGQNIVSHMVHDTATGTFNYIQRTPEGHFPPKG